MKILIVTQYFWPESFRINDLAEGLVERGHHVTVLTGKPNYPNGSFYSGYRFLGQSRENYKNIEIIRSPLIPRGKNSKIRLGLNYLSFSFFASIVGLFKCGKPDVIFVYEPSPITVGLPAIFLKKIKKAPILFWVQDLWPESVIAVDGVNSKKAINWLNKLVNFIYQNSDYILATSRSFFQSIKKFNIKDEKLLYFPQYAEKLYSPIARDKCAAEDQSLPDGFRIIFSGNIGIAQDIETIIQAAFRLKDQKHIKWIFLGDGSKRVWLQDEINRLGLTETVFWLGQHPMDRMPYFYACADALLVTLKKDPVFSLTIPAKIQSYLACAKPILAALDGEGRQVIEDSAAGLTANAGDPLNLAEIALKLSKISVEDRCQLGLNGKKYFDDHFERDSLLKKLENWMAELKEMKVA